MNVTDGVVESLDSYVESGGVLGRDHIDMNVVLEAALSQAEPAALSTPAMAGMAPEGYLFELRYPGDRWSGDMFSRILPDDPNDVRNVRPLYAAPSSTPAVEAVDVDRIACSLAQMVQEWVVNARKSKTDWSTGLQSIIHRRLLRFLATSNASPSSPAVEAGFQQRVDLWLLACFGETIARDKTERNHRFLEEALETVQAGGCTRSEAHQLVDYVFDRPVGELHQEIGGVMNTLAALCLAYGLDMYAAGETELARVWTKVEQIRAKQAAKPKHSPLPASPMEGWEPIETAPAAPSPATPSPLMEGAMVEPLPKM